MRSLLAAAIVFAACRGEPTPRDYQNNPPAMTHPVTTSSQTPTAQGMPGASPEPSTAAEGKTNRKPTSPVPPTLTLKDQPPTTTSTGGPPPQNSPHATQTTATAVTGTHLATPP
jgi:hypothetical protein